MFRTKEEKAEEGVVSEVERKSGKVSGKMREESASRRSGLCPGSGATKVSTDHDRWIWLHEC